MKATDHRFVVALELGLLGWGDIRCAVDGFMEDGIVGVVLFHRTEVVGTFEKVLALSGCIFRAHRLTVNTLRRKTL